MFKSRSLSKLLTIFVFVIIAVVVIYKIYVNTGASKLNSNSIVKEKSVNQSPANVTLRDSITTFGMELLGTPYVAAGCSKDGFDCSGFVYFVFKNHGIEVPRSSVGFENFGTEVPIEKAQKGDILVFLSPTRNEIGHLGIVTKANGKESDFIHASSGREMKVIITNLSNESYTRRFVKAVRVIQ